MKDDGNQRRPSQLRIADVSQTSVEREAKPTLSQECHMAQEIIIYLLNTGSSRITFGQQIDLGEICTLEA